MGFLLGRAACTLLPQSGSCPVSFIRPHRSVSVGVCTHLVPSTTILTLFPAGVTPIRPSPPAPASFLLLWPRGVWTVHINGISSLWPWSSFNGCVLKVHPGGSKCSLFYD